MWFVSYQWSEQRNRNQCIENMRLINRLILKYHLSLDSNVTDEASDFVFPSEWADLDELMPMKLNVPRRCPSGHEYTFDTDNMVISCPLAKEFGHEHKPGGISWKGYKMLPNGTFIWCPKEGPDEKGHRAKKADGL